MIDLLQQFETCLHKGSLENLHELTFRILYPLDPPVQINAAKFMMNSYMPIYQSRGCKTEWAKTLLQDPQIWLNQSGTDLPDEDSDSLSNNIFHSGFDGILLACSNKSNPLILTSACAYAIYHAVAARSWNVWEADEPEAAELKKQMQSWILMEPGIESMIDKDSYKRLAKRMPQKTTPTAGSATEYEGYFDEEVFFRYVEKMPQKNIAYNAVQAREWRRLLDWSKQLKPLFQPYDQQTLERHLAIWKEKEYFLIFPPKE